MSLHQSLAPGCEPACHGCRHRHLTAAASLAQKQGYLARTLAPWGDRLCAVAGVAEHERLGYRERVTLTAGWDAATGWNFGLMRRDELIPIHECPVHAPRVNRLVASLRSRLPPAHEWPLAYLHVSGGQATLVVKARTVARALLPHVADAMPGLGFDGLWLHLHPAAGRRLFARSGWELLWGSAQSRTVDGMVHGPTAFQQLLPRLHQASLDVAAAHLVPKAGSAVLDLYCGAGASLRRWVRAGAGATLGVELAGGAVECVPVNAPDAVVLRGTCQQRLPQVREWWGALAGPRAVYVNPPRSGLEADVLQALTSDLRPERVAYLSCSAGTLARDLAEFEQCGFRVDALHPYDFFPGTHHVECLALLSRIAVS
jgi:tRNA/tmRNA/rRNA uracil-C5-methylase (TrmA/RlmC/RlmD family)